MGRILLALIALVGLMWFFSQVGRLTGRERNAFVLRAAIYAVVGIVLLAVLTGRAPVIFAAVAAVVPWLQRAALLGRVARSLGAFGIHIPGLDAFTRDAFGSADSRYLKLSRDRRSGRVSGRILAGRFAGCSLDELGLPDLLLLHAEIKRDEPGSLDNLELYLDQGFDGWRQQSASGAITTHMTRTEALEVLGLEDGATRDEIVDAHRKLISRLHPDKGGNTYLAVKVNQAKDTLLG